MIKKILRKLKPFPIVAILFLTILTVSATFVSAETLDDVITSTTEEVVAEKTLVEQAKEKMSEYSAEELEAIISKLESESESERTENEVAVLRAAEELHEEIEDKLKTEEKKQLIEIMAAVAVIYIVAFILIVFIFR